MSRRQTALMGADIHDGISLHSGMALLLEDGLCGGLVAEPDLPERCEKVHLEGGTILPGFVDLQVNGGGGVMLNDDQSVGTLARMAEAHASVGTLALLPTLITDTPERTEAAIDAVAQAIDQGVAGVIGLHLEGPHLSLARKGAHSADLIRPMEARDLDVLTAAAGRLPNLMMTLAPENVTREQIHALSEAGVIVSLGHSDVGFDDATGAIDQGARAITHLFNAMSQLGSREPGLVGAALADGRVSAGLIADGIHVHPETIRSALAAKRGPGEVFLVTDAMSPVGSDIMEFTLNGRQILRRDGRLTLEDGTLAGADLDMPKALRVLTRDVGLGLEQAIRMATSAPARVLRDARGFGAFVAGRPAHAIHLNAGLTGVTAVGALLG